MSPFIFQLPATIGRRADAPAPLAEEPGVEGVLIVVVVLIVP